MIFNYKTMVAVFIAVLVSGSVMAQSVDLTMKWKPDYQYKIIQSVGLNMTSPSPQGGGDIATKMNMVMGMQGPSAIDEKGTILEMKFDTISMKMTMAGNEIINYDSTRPEQDSRMSKALAPLLELEFKTLYAEDGKFIELKDFDEKLLTPEMGINKESLESVMKQQSEMIPHRIVKVGEIWEANLIAPLKCFEGGLSCNYDFKLVSLKEVEGKQIARIEFIADMDKVKVKKNGVDMVMSAKNIDGYYLFDVKDGQFTESKVFFDMVAEVKGVEMMMQMNMTIEFGNSELKK